MTSKDYLPYSIALNLMLILVSINQVWIPAHDVSLYHYNQIKWAYFRGCLKGAAKFKVKGQIKDWTRESPGFVCKKAQKKLDKIFEESYDIIWNKAMRIYPDYYQKE